MAVSEVMLYSSMGDYYVNQGVHKPLGGSEGGGKGGDFTPLQHSDDTFVEIFHVQELEFFFLIICLRIFSLFFEGGGEWSFRL